MGTGAPAGAPGPHPVSTSGKAIRATKLAAFDRLVAEYEAPLLRYAGRILRDSAAAQDVVQETFMRLFRTWSGEWEPHPQLSGWLYRVTHNAAVDHLRSETRRRDLHERHAEEAPQELPPDRGSAFRVSDAAAAAAQAMQALTLREQQLVILKVYEEKTYREISTITGLTVSNVGYILHHAMRKLAGALQQPASPSTASPREGDAHG